MKARPRQQGRQGFRRGTLLRCGFTLIEMVLSLAILGLLVGGIFAISSGSLRMSRELTETQERAMLHDHFLEFCRRSFRQLPSHAKLSLELQSAGGYYLPSLVVDDPGPAFAPFGAMPPDARLVLAITGQRGGGLTATLQAWQPEEARAARANRSAARPQSAPLPLLDRLTRCEWRFLDARTQRWETVWKEAERPRLAELTLALDQEPPERILFDIPPAAAVASPVPAPAANPGPDPSPMPSPLAPVPSPAPAAP